MKTTSVTLSLFVLLSICGACTITKRHFGSGYHVEWKHHFSDKTQEESGSAKKSVDEPEQLLETEIAEKERDSVPLILPAGDYEVKSDSLAVNDISLKETPKQSLFKFIRPLKIIKQLTPPKREAKDHSKPQKSNSKPVEILTWIALGIFGLFLTAVLVIYLMGMLTNLTAIFLLLLTVIASFVLSTISLKRVLNSPEDYSGKAITITVFVLSLLITLGVIIYLIHFTIQAIMNIW